MADAENRGRNWTEVSYRKVQRASKTSGINAESDAAQSRRYHFCELDVKPDQQQQQQGPITHQTHFVL